MFIKQLYTNCLSEAAYYVESEGEAAIIDPLRDVDVYEDLAKERNAVIRYIFETHFHADFVSGHLELGKKTGAPIIYGPKTETSFDIYHAADGESFKLGGISIEVLHTPGHTIESSCYLVRDEKGAPSALFSGDTLFVGDVGRPDLSSGNLSKTELAGMLYDSLHEKILTLPDDVLVYPAHGAGSSCGKNLGPSTYSSIGVEKKTNYALQAPSKEAFIDAVTEGLTPPPQYFPLNARINKEGYRSLDKILEKGLSPLSPVQVANLLEKDEVILLDTRNENIFCEGFIPGSVGIGLNGRFAEWAGSLLPFEKPLILLTEAGKEKETIVRLSRVGFEEIIGYIDGGFEAWKNDGRSIDMIVNVDGEELAMDLPFDENLVVVDVRRETEFADGHVKEALKMPLNEMMDPASMATLEDHHNIYLYCGSGYRSVIAASLMKRQGIHNLHNIIGGWNSIQQIPNIPLAKENSVLN
jgi:glyoxylase-like metal-dependent hydrolase (beta-lactamase superfamily II)/rhodanese-related sulfurtransferase